jgi:hypothetical protein
MIAAGGLEPAEVVDAWDAFFFTPQSGAVSALFRIALGLVLTVDAVLTMREAPFTLGPHGLYDHETYRAAPTDRRPSLFRVLPPTTATNRAIVGLYLGSSVAFLIGLATPVAAVGALIALWSIHFRNPMVTHSADTLLRHLLLYAVFLPTAQVWAADAWLLDRDPSALVTPWALRLIQLQIAIVYLRTAFWKLRGSAWRDGSAVYDVLSLDALRRHELPARLQRPAVYRSLTWGTLAYELGFPLLVWFAPLRWPALAAGVAFHLSLQWFIRIRLFQWVMLAGLVAFIPADDATRWLL